MANTLNLGTDGNWGTKENSLLGYNSQNSAFKPLAFDFTRASNGTRVNKAGLIETVGNGIPRIDFLGNTEGALLLEPQRTNLITQSESFGNTYWTKSGASIQGDPTTAGSELVTNGDFSNGSTDWSLGGGWSVSGEKALAANVNGGYLTQNINLINAKTYKIQFSVSDYVSGDVRVRFSGGGGFISTELVSGNNTYTLYLESIGNTEFRLQGQNTFTGSIDNVSVKEVQGFASPSADSPLGAFKMVSEGNNANIIARPQLVSNTTNTFSLYMKRITGVGLVSLFKSNGNEEVVTLTNEWTRVSTTNSINPTNAYAGVKLATIGDEIMIFGAQIEQGSYPTSYIKTEGSAVTRLADSCDNGGNDQVINSTEGVLYAEIAALANDGTDRAISLVESNSNTISLFYFLNTNTIRALILKNGLTQAQIDFVLSDATDFNKLALKYKENDCALWVNGIEVGTDINATMPTALNSLDFKYASSYFYGKTKQIQYFDTALTDQELQALTQV